jgi:arsenate reductase (thioredoxin)
MMFPYNGFHSISISKILKAKDCRKLMLMNKLKVLFLCTGNSCRSQMAEGWTRHLQGDLIEVYSAGTQPKGLNPDAVLTMKEAGVDISSHSSQHIDEFAAEELDWIVTVCGHADETCPTFPRKTRVVHKGFDDPPALAVNAKAESERLAPYRRVRDEIRVFVETLPQYLNKETK